MPARKYRKNQLVLRPLKNQCPIGRSFKCKSKEVVTKWCITEWANVRMLTKRYGKVHAQWTELTNELTNKSKNQRDKSVKQRNNEAKNQSTMKQWIHEATKQWLNASMNEWIQESLSQWTNECMNQWINKKPVNESNETTKQWINESANQRTSDFNQLTDESMNRRIN